MFVAVDLGTSKTLAVMGQENDNGEMEIVAVGRCDTTGIEGGAIVDMDATTESIRKVIGDIQLKSGKDVLRCYVGVSGNTVTCVDNDSMVSLPKQIVQEDDILRVIEAARNTAQITKDARILHTIPHSFTLNNETKVRNPQGMSGSKLDAKVQLICCNEHTLRNIEACFAKQKSAIEINGIVLNQLAESYMALHEDEKEHGICLIKIGAGATDVGVYLRGALRYYYHLPMGGELITRAMLASIHTSPSYAEEIKRKYACAKGELASGEQLIRIPAAGKNPMRELQRSTLADIIEPCYSEIFDHVDKALEQSGFKRALFGGGIVLTGGGAKIEGAATLAEEIFRMPVDLEYDNTYAKQGLAGPEYSTALGLLKYAIAHNKKATPKGNKNNSPFRSMLHRWLH